MLTYIWTCTDIRVKQAISTLLKLLGAWIVAILITTEWIKLYIKWGIKPNHVIIDLLFVITTVVILKLCPKDD